MELPGVCADGILETLMLRVFPLNSTVKKSKSASVSSSSENNGKHSCLLELTSHPYRSVRCSRAAPHFLTDALLGRQLNYATVLPQQTAHEEQELKEAAEERGKLQPRFGPFRALSSLQDFLMR